MFSIDLENGIAWAGIILSHLAHLFSSLLLYNLSLKVFKSHQDKEKIALVTGVLYVVSPAGIFLSAPYSEALFALIQLAGYLLYVEQAEAIESKSTLRSELLLLMSGVLLGSSTLIRSNGILNGLIFAYEAIACGITILRHGLSFNRLRRLVTIGIAGIAVGLPFVYPQYLAYQQYCHSDNPSSWCNNYLPSIYAHVQSFYW
jgi:phosphatidylinositol glycan class V